MSREIKVFTSAEEAYNEGYEKGFIAGADTTGNQATEIMAEALQQERERIIEEIEKIRDCPHCNTKQQISNITLKQ